MVSRQQEVRMGDSGVHSRSQRQKTVLPEVRGHTALTLHHSAKEARTHGVYPQTGNRSERFPWNQQRGTKTEHQMAGQNTVDILPLDRNIPEELHATQTKTA